MGDELSTATGTAGSAEGSDQYVLRRLRAVGVFTDVHDAQLAVLAGGFAVRRVQAADVILREGDEDHELNVLAEGRLRIERTGPDDERAAARGRVRCPARRDPARADDAPVAAFRHQTMMRYRLPHGAVAVSGDLPLLPSQQVSPDVLATLEHPELRLVAERYGTPSGRRWLANCDWANLDERMTFRLFRPRQKSLELFDPPFQYEQRPAIAGDQLPSGAL
jgi:hypothetical protein